MDFKLIILLVLIGVLIFIWIRKIQSEQVDNSYKDSYNSTYKSDSASIPQKTTSERHVEELSEGESYTYTTEDTEHGLPEHFVKQIRKMKQDGQVINAIKEVREFTGWDLKKSKDFVTQLDINNGWGYNKINYLI